MTTKAEFRRIKASLERQANHLKADGLELERRRLAMTRERDEAILLLRLLCERHGSNDWPDELPLREILERHLAGPLEARLDRLFTRLAELQQAAAQLDQQPAPVRAVPPEPAQSGHRLVVGLSQARGGPTGYQASCSCNWRSALATTQALAETAADDHHLRMTGAPRLRTA